MARPRSSILNPPSYRLHRASGQAIVEIAGRRCYLGVYGSPGSWAKYHASIASIGLDAGAANVPAVAAPPSPAAMPAAPSLEPEESDGIRIAELCDRFLVDAATYYRDAHGKPTAEVLNYERVAGALVKLHGRIEAANPTFARGRRQSGWR